MPGRKTFGDKSKRMGAGEQISASVLAVRGEQGLRAEYVAHAGSLLPKSQHCIGTITEFALLWDCMGLE